MGTFQRIKYALTPVSVSCDVMWCHVMSCDVMWCHWLLWVCHVMLCDVTDSCECAMWCHVMSLTPVSVLCDVMWCHWLLWVCYVMSCDVTDSCECVMWCHVMSFDVIDPCECVMWCHVMSLTPMRLQSYVNTALVSWFYPPSTHSRTHTHTHSRTYSMAQERTKSQHSELRTRLLKPQCTVLPMATLITITPLPNPLFHKDEYHGDQTFPKTRTRKFLSIGREREIFVPEWWKGCFARNARRF